MIVNRNISSTKFYDGIMHSPYKNGSIKSYDHDGNEYPLYNADGTAKEYPAKLDAFGNIQAYFDKDITYSVVYFDENGIEKETFQDIQLLQGKAGIDDGSPEPDPADYHPPQGFPGLQGNSVIGPPASDAEVALHKGNKGVPPYNRIVAQSNVQYNIPVGIDAIYITASAGGGSAGNWSKYLLMLPTKDFNNISKYQENVGVRINGNSYDANNKQIWDGLALQMISMTPGSGKCGDSCFRKKITISDTTKSHTLNVFIGNGGASSDPNVSLNGNKGNDTTVYLDDTLVLTLKGGLAGENSFPINDAQAESLIENFKKGFYQNFGKDSTFLIWQNVYNDSSKKAGQWQPQSGGNYFINLFGYKSQYRKKTGNTYTLQDADQSYKTMYYQFNINPNYYIWYSFIYNDDFWKGGVNNFGEHYQRLSSADTINIDGNSNYNGNNEMQGMVNSIKDSISDGSGSGAGGDVFYGFFSNGKTQGWHTTAATTPANYVFFSDNSRPSDTIVFYNQTYSKTVFINYLNNFMMPDSYEPGVLKVPTLTGDDDNPDVWDVVENAETLLKNQKTKVIDGPAFYNFGNLAHGQYNNNLTGGAGANGYCLIEYGVIKSNISST